MKTTKKTKTTRLAAVALVGAFFGVTAAAQAQTWYGQGLRGTVAGSGKPVDVRIDHQREHRRDYLAKTSATLAYINLLARDGSRPGIKPGLQGVTARVKNVVINPLNGRRHVVSEETVPLKPSRSRLYGQHYSGKLPAPLKLAEATYQGPNRYEQVVQLDVAGKKVRNPINRSTWFDFDMLRAPAKR